MAAVIEEEEAFLWLWFALALSLVAMAPPWSLEFPVRFLSVL